MTNSFKSIDITPITVWGVMMKHGTAGLEEWRAGLAEGGEDMRLVDFDVIRKLLSDQIDEIICRVVFWAVRFEGMSDKEVGQLLPTLDPIVARFIFPYRRVGNARGAWALGSKMRRTLYYCTRPDGNQLLGYTLSGKILRIG